MKYEILDKDTQGVIVSSDGKLYKVEYPFKDIRTIGMSSRKIVTYIDWKIGEQIDYMDDTPVSEYIEPSNEVEQSLTNQGQIIYLYKKGRNVGLSGVGNIWMTGALITSIFNAQSLNNVKL